MVCAVCTRGWTLKWRRRKAFTPSIKTPVGACLARSHHGQGKHFGAHSQIGANILLWIIALQYKINALENYENYGNRFFYFFRIIGRNKIRILKARVDLLYYQPSDQIFGQTTPNHLKLTPTLLLQLSFFENNLIVATIFSWNIRSWSLEHLIDLTLADEDSNTQQC